MIKIRPIDATLIEKYSKDNFKRIKSLLISLLFTVKYERLIRYLSTNGQLDDAKIKQLMIGDIKSLTSALCSIGKILDEGEDEGFHKLYKNFTSRNLGKAWAEEIGVSICPYCNRSYIYTLRRSGVRPQYDHFFPKSLYPYLALSMYNLVPCCSVCNGSKHNIDTFDSVIGERNFIYPYEDAYSTSFLFQTSFVGDVNAWLGNSENFELKIVAATGANSNLQLREARTCTQLKLEALYNKHKDYVRDIIKTAYIYNSDYFQGLAASYPGIFQNAQEAESLVYMNYLEEESWDKRVLAKLTYDIRNEYHT